VAVATPLVAAAGTSMGGYRLGFLTAAVAAAAGVGASLGVPGRRAAKHERRRPAHVA
jgi:hypothetical protein